MKEGIIELRQKGASLRLIRELLATVDVLVGTDTIARFLAEVNGETTTRSRKRTGRRRALTHATSSPQPPIAPTTNAASTPARRPVDALLEERPRSRGPRVADPRNL